MYPHQISTSTRTRIETHIGIRHDMIGSTDRTKSVLPPEQGLKPQFCHNGQADYPNGRTKSVLPPEQGLKRIIHGCHRFQYLPIDQISTSTRTRIETRHTRTLGQMIMCFITKSVLPPEQGLKPRDTFRVPAAKNARFTKSVLPPEQGLKHQMI